MSKGGLVGSAQSGADRYRRRLLAAAGLSNNLLLSNLNTTVTIKSSPPKTAEETARLGIISGFLTKRNEQHSWQRRFCALVPQTFLYYFEDEEADAPRGIIDLEYYTDISAQPNNIVKLASTDGSQRTFYFKADSEEEMNAWMSALIRERYFVLRDERDAYQELQHDFQAQSAADADEVRRASVERHAMIDLEARALREEAEVAHQLNELRTALESVVPSSVIGIAPDTPSETIGDTIMSQLEAGGRALVERVAELEARLVESRNGAARLEEELRDYRDQVQGASAELDVEARALAREQKLKANEMSDVASLNAELEEGEVNLGIIERTKFSAEQRVAELTEHKKLLVREVKSARTLLAAKREQVKEEITSRESLSPPPQQSKQPPSWISNHHPPEDDDQSGDLTPSSVSTDEVLPPQSLQPTASSRFFDSAARLFDDIRHIQKPVYGTAKKSSLLSTDDEGEMPSDDSPNKVVIRCKRCGGTLEGPRNSTCTCLEPLLDDETAQAPAQAQPTVTSYFKSLAGMFSSPTKNEADNSATLPIDHAGAAPNDHGSSNDDAPPAEPREIADGASEPQAPSQEPDGDLRSELPADATEDISRPDPSRNLISL